MGSQRARYQTSGTVIASLVAFRMAAFAVAAFLIPAPGISQTAQQPAPCSFDEATSTFHISPENRPANSMVLRFGTHGSPQLKSEYIRGGDPQDPKRIRALIANHGEGVPAMRATFNESLKRFRTYSPRWLSYENSQKDIDAIGGFNGLMEFLKGEDRRLEKLGLKAEERKSYLSIMSDPVIAALYWSRYKEGRAGDQVPTLFGFDNARTDGLSEKKEMVHKIFVEYDDRRAALNDPKHGIPAWFYEEYKARNISYYYGYEPDRSVNQLRELIKDPRFNSIPLQGRNAIFSIRDFMTTHLEKVRDVLKAEEEEFAKRDREIARDLFETEMSTAGTGIAHIGALHKDGVLSHLSTICLQRSGSGPLQSSPTVIRALPKVRTTR